MKMMNSNSCKETPNLSKLSHRHRNELAKEIINLMSGLSGKDLKAITIEWDSPRALREGCAGYTQGSCIYIATGMEECMAHEIWHVVQHLQGRTVMGGSSITSKIKKMLNCDTVLEKEADIMSALCMQIIFFSKKSTHLGYIFFIGRLMWQLLRADQGIGDGGTLRVLKKIYVHESKMPINSSVRTVEIYMALGKSVNFDNNK